MLNINYQIWIDCPEFYDYDFETRFEQNANNFCESFRLNSVNVFEKSFSIKIVETLMRFYKIFEAGAVWKFGKWDWRRISERESCAITDEVWRGVAVKLFLL